MALPPPQKKHVGTFIATYFGKVETRVFYRMTPHIKVLLIDDDEDDFFITKDLLSDSEQYNFVLDWEPSFNQALEKIVTAQHDIYLVDFRLGEQSGLQLIQAAQSSGQRGPFIILTGQEELAVDMAALQAGATDYLVKSRLDGYILEKAILYAIERNKVSEALHQNEQRYRGIFESSTDAILLCDQSLRCTMFNDSALRLLECHKDYLEGLSLRDMFLSEKDFNRYENDVLTGKNAGSEFELRNCSGAMLWCVLTTAPLTDSLGNLKGYQTIFHDVSARKRAEREMIIAEKLSMTGRIARSIAHEVRNPLTNVVLSLEQLKMGIEENEETKLYTDIISKNCKRINQLISELLASAKPTELDLQPNSINDTILETLELAQDRIKLLGIELITDLDKSVPCFPHDKEKLKMAFINIIINAIEAMKEEGTKRLRIATTVDNFDNCVVEIADNGVGIPQENIGKLFDAFFTGKKTGTGLGLTTTHNIIATHKGSIDIESEVGRGTTFFVSFDLNKLIEHTPLQIA